MRQPTRAERIIAAMLDWAEADGMFCAEVASALGMGCDNVTYALKRLVDAGKARRTKRFRGGAKTKTWYYRLETGFDAARWPQWAMPRIASAVVKPTLAQPIAGAHKSEIRKPDSSAPWPRTARPAIACNLPSARARPFAASCAGTRPSPSIGP